MISATTMSPCPWKIISTPGLPWSPSPPHHLWPSSHLVWSDSQYFTRNCTISTTQNLLHSSHHVRNQGRWEFGEYKLIYSDYSPIHPSISLPHGFLCCDCCSILCHPEWAAHQALMVTIHHQIRHHCNFKWVLLLLNFIHFSRFFLNSRKILVMVLFTCLFIVCRSLPSIVSHEVICWKVSFAKVIPSITLICCKLVPPFLYLVLPLTLQPLCPVETLTW